MSALSTWAGVALASVVLLAGFSPLGFAGASHATPSSTGPSAASNGSAVGNFSAALDRIVVLLGAAGGGLLAIVWARVALSWFSNDVTKKIQAKDRARDALVGTLLFSAALSGLIWGLARWVLTGS
ncbi:MAG: hypothetical protein L3J77_03525 [Thermoplasmata archaeon]|nr:hypothetical protein [Thermoplasmata archaeon]